MGILGGLEELLSVSALLIQGSRLSLNHLPCTPEASRLCKEVPDNEAIVSPGLEELSIYLGWDSGNPALLLALAFG